MQADRVMGLKQLFKVQGLRDLGLVDSAVLVNFSCANVGFPQVRRTLFGGLPILGNDHILSHIFRVSLRSDL